MTTFFALFRLEFRRFVSRRNVLILSLLAFFLLYFLQTGIDQYHSTLKNNEEFKKIEKSKVAGYINYAQYGAMGIRMIFSPSPLSVLFSNTGVISNMTARTDTGSKLEIYNSLKGKNGFILKSFGFTDFSGILLYFGSLLALLYGFDTFQHRDYLRFLSALSHHRRVFIYIIFSRILLIIFTTILIMASSLIMLVFNHLNVSDGDYRYFCFFCLTTILLLLFFFLLGTITSTMKTKMIGLITLIISWFVLVFFIPAAIHAIVASRAEVMTPVYTLEFEKFKLFTGFEQRAIREQGILNKEKDMPQSERDLVENYMENEFLKMQDLEAEMSTQMRSNISLYQSLSLFSPPTIYFSNTNEISSKGYDNLMDFYEKSQEIKLNFLRYYINQIYYHNNFSKVQSFIKTDENVYKAVSRVPDTFNKGMITMLLYFIISLLISYRQYLKIVFEYCPSWEGGLRNPRLFLDEGDLRPFFVEDPRFNHQMFNLLSGQNSKFKRHQFKDKIYISDIDIVEEPYKEAFFYLCRIDNLPGDIKVGSLLKVMIKMLRKPVGSRTYNQNVKITGQIPLDFVNIPFTHKSLSKLDQSEKETLLMAILKHQNRAVYLLYDITKFLSIEFVIQLKNHMESLCDDGAIVFYLTSDYHPFVKTLRKDETFYEHLTWLDVVDSIDNLSYEENQRAVSAIPPMNETRLKLKEQRQEMERKLRKERRDKLREKIDKILEQDNDADTADTPMEDVEDIPKD